MISVSCSIGSLTGRDGGDTSGAVDPAMRGTANAQISTQRIVLRMP